MSRKQFKLCAVGIDWIALVGDSRMSTCMCQGFNHFSGFLHHFVLAKLASSSIRVKVIHKTYNYSNALELQLQYKKDKYADKKKKTLPVIV